MADEFDTNEGLTRREALKKGAMLGGALVWAVPVVQTVGMSAAMAREPSEGECCLRIVNFAVTLSALEPPTANDFQLDLTLKNCGDNQITNVRYSIDRKVEPGDWETPSAFTGFPNIINPGITRTGQRFQYDATAGTYWWRVTATFDCLGVSYTQQTIPAQQYVENGPFVIPA
jgi:hypothetical protein